MQTNDYAFIEMEKMNGGTLQDVIDKAKDMSISPKSNSSGNSAEDNFSSKANKHQKLNYKEVIDEDTTASLMKDILSGLCKIHERNFIHRDLKPENILINVLNEDERATMGDQFKPRYIAKIADFGLSAEIKYGIFSGKNHIDDRMGTLLYMAPEQAQGKVYGKRVDLWALGVIMYIMLTG
jgi:serine/threonine protein kinase